MENGSQPAKRPGWTADVSREIAETTGQYCVIVALDPATYRADIGGWIPPGYSGVVEFLDHVVKCWKAAQLPTN